MHNVAVDYVCLTDEYVIVSAIDLAERALELLRIVNMMKLYAAKVALINVQIVGECVQSRRGKATRVEYEFDARRRRVT